MKKLKVSTDAVLKSALLSFLFIISYSNISYSKDQAVILPPDTIIFDTLVHGAIEFTAIDYNGDTLYTDTSSRHGLIMDMCGKFKNYEYCYVGAVDSVVSGIADYPVPLPYDTQQELPEYYIDTVYVSIDTVLKGKVDNKQYLFLDSQSTIKPLYDYAEAENSLEKSVSKQEIYYNSYSQLSGRKFVFFGDDPYDLRKSTIKPGDYYYASGNNSGHYLDDSLKITNQKEFPYVNTSVEDFYDAVNGRFLIIYNPLVYIQLEELSQNLIIPPRYPSPDFLVYDQNDRSNQRVSAVFDTALSMLDKEDSIITEEIIVRGYFEPDSMKGWEHKPLCFFITDILDETRSDSRITSAEKKLLNNNIRFSPDRNEVVFDKNINLIGSTVSIFNVSGRKIFSRENISNQNKSIKIPGYISGPCFIKFNNGDKNMIKKLVILR